MKKNHITYIILFSIVSLGFLLRVWQLGNIPKSLDWDEVSLGYNAYSMLLTGKDEFGRQFPFILQSFGDYKPGLYSYLIIPFIKLFGLGSWAVRLPSVIFGTAAIVATYFLVKQLVEQKNKNVLALLSSFFLAISPLSIQFSRVAFEANVGVTLNILAILFFLKGLTKPSYFILASILFSTSLYVYQGEKAFVPLMVLLLGMIFKPWKLSFAKPSLMIAVIVGLIIALPMLSFSLLNKNGLARAQGTSILNGKTPIVSERMLVRIKDDTEEKNYIGLLFDNRRVLYVRAVIGNYLSHFNPNWYFTTGDSVGRHQPPHMGHMYLWELPFLLIGMYILLFYPGFTKQTKLLLFGWLLITPVGASITWDVPNATRTLNFLPLFQFFCAIGVMSAYSFLSAIKVKKAMFLKNILLAIAGVVFILNSVYFLDQYFVQYNYFGLTDWQYGYKEAMQEASVLQKDKRVFIDKGFEQPYIFYLFYNQYDPQKYIQTSGSTRNTNPCFHIDAVFFGNCLDMAQKGDILITTSNTDLKKLKSISYPNGSIAVIIYEK